MLEKDNQQVTYSYCHYQEGAVLTSFLSTREVQSADGEELAQLAEEGLKELITCAGLAHIDSVIKPVLQ